MAGHVFGRATGAALPTAVAGDGCYIIDADGRRYLDGSGGAAVSCLGHSDPDVRAAIHDQLDRIAFAHTGFFTSDPAEALADLLVEAAPEGIDRVYLLSGGSEAVEAAIKLARQYFLEIGEPQRHRLIARRQSYHGNTLGALAAGGNAWRREKYAPLLVETHHISPCYEYRGRRDDESAEAFGLRVATSSRPRSSASAPRPSWPSSPNPWWAPPPARCPPCPAISSASARSATVTACS
jgi:adenosylmethionine-8-amino-7-oxononanoate aminotransferase